MALLKNVCTSVLMYIRLMHMYVSVYVRMYVRMYVCTYICIMYVLIPHIYCKQQN